VTVLRFLPPLTISQADVDTVVDQVADVLRT
jgi:4-aminobutyrate aminotransferase-like enzyme